jgi:hypothetical protein
MEVATTARDEMNGRTARNKIRAFIFHSFLSGARIRSESGNCVKHEITAYHLLHGSAMEIKLVNILHTVLHIPSGGVRAPWRV